MANIREILKEKRANEANYVYLTAYAIVVLKAFYSFSEILSHYYEQRIFTVCNIVAISILAIKLLFFQDYSIRQIFILIFLAFSTFYTDTRLGLFLFLLNFLIIAATQNVDTHWVLSVMNKIQIIVLGIHIALYPIYYFFLPDHVKFTYRNGDYNHDFCLSGYMEYHAAQVELVKIVGAETVETPVSFSMKDKIDEMHEMIQQYVDNKLEMAQKLMESHDQKEKIDGINALFNFFGLKSICSMYATDYVDNYTYQSTSMRMSSWLFTTTRFFMTGWIENVDKAICLYSNVIAEVLN